MRSPSSTKMFMKTELYQDGLRETICKCGEAVEQHLTISLQGNGIRLKSGPLAPLCSAVLVPSISLSTDWVGIRNFPDQCVSLKTAYGRGHKCPPLNMKLFAIDICEERVNQFSPMDWQQVCQTCSRKTQGPRAVGQRKMDSMFYVFSFSLGCFDLFFVVVVVCLFWFLFLVF